MTATIAIGAPRFCTTTFGLDGAASCMNGAGAGTIDGGGS